MTTREALASLQQEVEFLVNECNEGDPKLARQCLESPRSALRLALQDSIDALTEDGTP